MDLEKEILRICLEKGFLLDKEMLKSISLLDESSARTLIEILNNLGIKERVITRAVFHRNFEKIRSIFVNGKNRIFVEKFFINLGYSLTEMNNSPIIIDEENNNKLNNSKVKIISSPQITPKKIEVQDFVKHFKSRYEQIRNILQERNLENLTSIRRINEKKENKTVIVSILDKKITKNKNLIFDVEDLTGRAKVLVNNNRQELYNLARDVLVDEVVAFNVSGNSEILFANGLIFPDAVLPEKRKYDKDEWVAFTSDIHVGSTMFLENQFLKFIKWLNGAEGNEEQRELAKKVKYLFLVGDCVDGVGVYPDQEKFLKIKEISEQYSKLCEYLKLVRKDIKIIMSPGQHDAVWVGEPQPSISEKWAPGLYKLDNLSLVSNPCLVEINGGFKILMYHGASMHGIIEEIPEIRLNYGHNSPTRVTRELLKRRHLAPMHGSCDYIPNDKKDPMVIDILPDIVATGDQHRSEVANYNNILMIASSCWQSITPFEEKVGNNPEPCRVPLFNLKTREIKIMDFSEGYEHKPRSKL